MALIVFAAILAAIEQKLRQFQVPFFSGGFLYLGASDLLPESHRRSPSILTVFSCIGGFVSIFLLTYVLANVLGL
jgi:zinc transporter ZupT